MSTEITLSDIASAQQSWATAVQNRDIQELMALYAANAVLKPTLSNAIRRTPEDIRAYFVGGKKFNDAGFLNGNISEVNFLESDPKIFGDVAIDTGIYGFTKQNGAKVIAHFTFCYQINSDGKTLILTQHSSLESNAI